MTKPNLPFRASNWYYTMDGKIWYTALDTRISDQPQFMRGLADAVYEFENRKKEDG